MTAREWFTKAQKEGFAIGALRLRSGHAIVQRIGGNPI